MMIDYVNETKSIEQLFAASSDDCVIFASSNFFFHTKILLYCYDPLALLPEPKPLFSLPLEMEDLFLDSSVSGYAVLPI
jgi:hypothetical protein